MNGDLINKYDTLADAAEKSALPKSSIWTALNTGNPYKGFTWVYANPVGLKRKREM